MSVEISQSRFIRFDYEILAAKKLHLMERLVLALIVSFERSNRRAYFNNNYLEWAGLEASDMYKIKKKLEKLGLINLDEEGRASIPSLPIFYKQLENLR